MLYLIICYALYRGYNIRIRCYVEYRIFVGKPEGKKPVGRPTRRWVDYIKMDLTEIGWGGMDWIGLAENRDQWRDLVNTVMNLRVPWNAGKFLSSCTIGGFSRRTQLHE
jgi:hypothetical protein